MLEQIHLKMLSEKCCTLSQAVEFRYGANFTVTLVAGLSNFYERNLTPYIDKEVPQ